MDYTVDRTGRPGGRARAARRLAEALLAIALGVLLACSPLATATTAAPGAPDEPEAEAAALADPASEPTPPPLPPAEVASLGRMLPAATAEAPTFIGEPAPEISAAAAVVLDGASAAVLYGKDEHERRGPASLTKIATAIIAAEHGDLDAVVVSSVDGREMPRSSLMGLEPGDEFRLRDLVYGLMLPSGNDAALVIARHMAGSEEAFAQQMTALARRLGLTDTNFRNPHGLGRRNHYSSAYDLAILTRYMMDIPFLREVVAAPAWEARGSREIEMKTLNPLLGKVDGVDGVKTGYTRSSGLTYVVSVERDGHRIYVVLLDAPERPQDARLLIEWAYESHTWPE